MTHPVRVWNSAPGNRGTLRTASEVILRTTGKGVQQIRAKFLEDDRRIQTLWFQRWNVEKGWPIGQQQITLIGSEIPRLIEFLNSISTVHIPGEGTFNVDFGKQVPVPAEAARNPSLHVRRN